MQFLKLKLPGAYLDAFFYQGHLYLLTAENTLQLLDWNRLIERVFPAKNKSGTDPLAAMVLTNNALAHEDRCFMDWAQYDGFKKVLLENLQQMDGTVLCPKEDERNEFDLGTERFHSIELFRSHVWLIGEEGVSYVKAGPGHAKGKCSRIYRVLDDCAFSIGVNSQSLWVMSPEWLHVVPICDISPRRVRVEFGEENAVPISANHIGWHWGDAVITSDFDFHTSIWMAVSNGHDRAGDSFFDERARYRRPVSNGYDKAGVSAHLERDQILRNNFTGRRLPTGKADAHFCEIELDIGQPQRLYCSRERAVGVSPKHTVQAFNWAFNFQRTQNGLADYTISTPDVERVLIGTFGWVVEETSGVLLIDKIKKTKLYESEPTQVRTFPSASWYENMVVVVGDDEIEIIAILDYDFLMPKKLRDVHIGRLSQFFSNKYKRYPTMGGGM